MFIQILYVGAFLPYYTCGWMQKSN